MSYNGQNYADGVSSGLGYQYGAQGGLPYASYTRGYQQNGNGSWRSPGGRTYNDEGSRWQSPGGRSYLNGRLYATNGAATNGSAVNGGVNGKVGNGGTQSVAHYQSYNSPRNYNRGYQTNGYGNYQTNGYNQGYGQSYNGPRSPRSYANSGSYNY